MKTIEYTTKRIQATTPEEKETAKSWGSLWQRFGTLERNNKPILLIFGDWSGYRSAQYRITHVDYAGYYSSEILSEDYHGTVQFSDNTTMSVWVRKVSRADILQNNYRRKQSYNDLISKLLNSGKNYYKVGKD